MQGAMGRYHDATHDFAKALEHFANQHAVSTVVLVRGEVCRNVYAGPPRGYCGHETLELAAEVLFDAAYDANLGVWPSDPREDA